MQQDKIWDYYQNREPESFSHSVGRLEYLARQIAKGSIVLDIGVGAGIFEQLASRRDLDVYCVDPNAESIAKIQKELNLGERAKVGYAQKLPFPEKKFDAVILSEVLEHLSLPILEETLREVRRVLKEGGRLLGTVPARENLQAQMVVCPHCGELFHRWGHQQSFDSESLARELSRYFKLQTIRERPFVTWQVLNWKGKTGLFLKYVLSLVGIHGTNESIFFTAVRQD